MPNANRTWLFSYDITDDATRSRTAAQLEGHGSRVLYSLFEVPAPRLTVENLHKAISADLSGHDALFALPTCGACGQAGQGLPLGWRPFVIVVGQP